MLLAIELVNALPQDHPLRPRINAQIDRWSEDLLRLGNARSFQEGKLRRGNCDSEHSFLETFPLTRRWKSRLKSGSRYGAMQRKFTARPEDHLRQEEWTLAFRQATLLLDLGNTFWESAKYEELTKLIQTTRAEGNKLVKARNKAAEGGLDNLVTGIKLAQGIDQNSYLYQAANKAIAEFSKKIMEIAQKRLQAGDWQEAIGDR